MNQKKASQAVSEGYFVVIIGENAHPETKSVLAFCGNNGMILECKDDIGKVPPNGKYCVISQTTLELAKFEEMLGVLRQSRPGTYRVEKSICLATSERQKAAAELAERVDAFVVLGGRNSANTRHLTELVRAICPRCYQVETAKELSPEMFQGCSKVGITAGASTPDRIIKEAVMAMENMENKKMEGDFAAMLDASMEDFGVHPGKLVNGKVSQVDKDGVYVDFGYTRDGLIAWKDWAVDADYEDLMDTVKEGDEVEAVVIPSSSEDFVGLSKIRAEKEAAWKNIAPLAEGEKRPAKVKVLRVIKKRNRDRDAENTNVRPVVGLAVAVEGVEGFMPASHVELRHIDDFTPYVGQELDAEIIEIDPEKKRIVVSRRDLLKAEKPRNTKNGSPIAKLPVKPPAPPVPPRKKPPTKRLPKAKPTKARSSKQRNSVSSSKWSTVLSAWSITANCPMTAVSKPPMSPRKAIWSMSSSRRSTRKTIVFPCPSKQPWKIPG